MRWQISCLALLIAVDCVLRAPVASMTLPSDVIGCTEVHG
jgi:hypothetical protein